MFSYRSSGKLPGFLGKTFFLLFFVGGSVFSAVGSAFPICSLCCVLGYLFLTFHFENKSLAKDKLGKVKSKFAYRKK